VGDVLDPASLAKAFAGAETVFHTAARITLKKSDPLATRINVEGTRNVVQACLDAGVKRLVCFGSIHMFSPIPEAEPIDESRARNDASRLAYDRSKAAAEREVQAGIDKGLDAVLVCPTAVVGPYDFKPSRMGQMLLDVCRRKLPALVTGGFNWVDVRDVAAGALAAEHRGQKGERYLLGGNYLTLTELAATAAQIYGVKPPSFVAPVWLAKLGAPFVEGFAAMRGKVPLFTSGAVETVQHHALVSHEKATRALGYEPRPIRQTLEETIGWFKQTGALP
jgi:dihydroflavonol-4-reductase